MRIDPSAKAEDLYSYEKFIEMQNFISLIKENQEVMSMLNRSDTSQSFLGGDDKLNE